MVNATAGVVVTHTRSSKAKASQHRPCFVLIPSGSIARQSCPMLPCGHVQWARKKIVEVLKACMTNAIAGVVGKHMGLESGSDAAARSSCLHINTKYSAAV